MTERKLRAVKAGEKAPVKRAPRKVTPKSVVAAAASGDVRQMLVALRNRIAQSIDDPNTPAPALAALIRQQMDIVARIEAIDLARTATKTGSSQQKSAIAETPSEAWDEGAI